MSTNELFDGSGTSLAAYASLNKDIGTDAQDNIDALKSAGMEQTQAEKFALCWPVVVDQYTNP